MHLVYMITAAVGCTALAVQVVLQLIGLGGDHGGDHVGHLEAGHHDGHAGDGGGQSNWFFGMLSLKSLTAFLAFFGLAGLAGEEIGLGGAAASMVVAILAGLAAAFVVMLIMRGLASLQSSGTAELDDAIGTTARVYLRIPGAFAGAGKITAVVGGREFELTAVTSGQEIPTGAVVEVVRRIDASTFEVSTTGVLPP
jgi:hypothetical protein